MLFSVCYKSATTSGTASRYVSGASLREVIARLPVNHPQYDGYILYSIDGHPPESTIHGRTLTANEYRELTEAPGSGLSYS
jgi:hypothetical protein